MKRFILIVAAFLSFNAYASGGWPDPWSEEIPDPCQGSFISSPYCSLDPDPLHCSWYYPTGVNHPLCEGRPSFPRICEIVGSCINPGYPIPPNPCLTEPAWCEGPTYRPLPPEAPPRVVPPAPPRVVSPAPVVEALPPADVLVVEYTAIVGRIGHFFLTANPEEMAALDAGSSWKRTGQTFMAWKSYNHQLIAVYRFYDYRSHYFITDNTIVADLRQTPGDVVEEGIAFWAAPASAYGCRLETRPVFELFSNYTTRWVTNPLATQLFRNTPGWWFSHYAFCVQ